MSAGAHRAMARAAVAALVAAASVPALAHHGTAAVSAIGAEGPGAALDTASPHEVAVQRGSEGFKDCRAALMVSYAPRS